MALTNSFYEAVRSKNIRRIRIMMKDSLLVDPTFTDFKEMNQEASLIQGLYDKHDGQRFNEDKSTWNKEYMDRLMVQVMNNFSHERIEHLKKVVRYLKPVDNTKNTRQQGTRGTSSKNSGSFLKQSDYQRQKECDQREGKYRPLPKEAIGATAGGAIGLVAGMIMSSSAPVTAGLTLAGVAAGAAIASTIDKE